MPRKTDPRQGEIMPRDPPVFLIDDRDATALAAFLGLSEPADINAIKASVEEIGETYLARRAQDEDGPTRAERNEALKQLAATEDFVRVLGSLNHRAESALVDALQSYTDHDRMKRLGVTGAFDLIEWVKRASGDRDLDSAIDHMRAAIEEYLPRLQSRRGPDYAINLSLAVDDVLDLYHRATGELLTHSVVTRDDNTEDVNSMAGRFVTMVFDRINRALTADNKAQIPPTRIFTEVRRAVRRFKNG